MQSLFRTIRLKAGETWAVVLTTQEGADHQIDGFATQEDAQSWVQRETGQAVSGTGTAWTGACGKAA